ncbi:MAG TPA: DUF4159 domain-containing protein, partial [Roseimicrobium sp.]|nr:DUF4159 domain-containing protein [Roseimicrobium sp.]
TNPQLAAAIDWLKKHETDGTYALGMRAQVWNHLSGNKDPAIQLQIRRDATLLASGATNTGGKGFRGLYYYRATDHEAYDSSCSQFGVLGMWALERTGLEIPDAYWQAVEAAWKKNQEADGGWKYVAGNVDRPTTLGMTAAGIATLFVTQDYLGSKSVTKCAGNTTNVPISRAMAWMESHLPGAMNDMRGARNDQVPLYDLFTLERIGLASGFKYVGKTDWYREGANALVEKQSPEGGWSNFGPGAGTSLGLIFLCRGRSPVVMNKLQYSLSTPQKPVAEANWNQRPRDAANLTRFIAKQMERELNWQIVNLDGDIDDLHDSPILYISGNQPLQFSEAEEGKLKLFVEQGGLILGHADCADAQFTKSFKALGKKLFGNAGEFRNLEATHPIYTRQQFLAKSWKSKPELMALSNGVRELMLLLPTGDLARSWQSDDAKIKVEHFQLMADVFLYTCEGKDLRYRGSTYIVKEDPKIKPTKSLTVARINVGINPDPEPGGWRRLAAVLHNENDVELRTEIVKLEGNALNAFKV